MTPVSRSSACSDIDGEIAMLAVVAAPEPN